jgi:DNA-binding transcriptional ArsR family regulator
VLKDAGLVSDRRDGNRRIYQLDPGGIRALRAYLDRFWNQSMAAFKAAVEKEEP